MNSFTMLDRSTSIRSEKSVDSNNSNTTTNTNDNNNKSNTDIDNEMTDFMGEEDENNNNKTFLNQINKFMNKQAKAFVRNFIDYGPPYTKKPYNYELVNECCKPMMNHRELHKFLNQRMNPNIPDPEDLYYYPIHWTARNIHLMALKMLCRAGAKVNVTNELGCTPLG